MKRNWYAAAILLVLCLLLYLAGRYVTDTTDAMQAGVQRAYALAEQATTLPPAQPMRRRPGGPSATAPCWRCWCGATLSTS